MATYRTVHLSFWTDTKVDEDFTPEDKYFYLYLLTNPHTNICGCYEISVKQMSRETGYNEDTIKRLLNRMEREHHVILYDKQTKEVLILNWGKYNWCNSPKTRAGAEKSATHIKNPQFKELVLTAIADTLSIPYPYPMDTPDTVLYIENIDSSSSLNSQCDEVIDFLNEVAGTKYKHKEASREHIRARLNDGFTVDDCKQVICNRWKAWRGTQYQQYMRPSTLFTPSKFEGYLNAGDQAQPDRYADIKQLMEETPDD